MDYRKIIHIDMDAFFASVEQRDNPELKGKPVVVGGTKERGVVSAASYEARKFGIRSAMPSWKAYQLNPNVIFVKPNFQAYKQVSDEINKIFQTYTDQIQTISLDEAYLDVTENKTKAVTIAKEIRKEIFRKTDLTASAGVSIAKFLAKIASDFNKPNGLTVVLPEEAPDFIRKLKIGKIPGVGKVTEQKMSERGIFTCADFLSLEKSYIKEYFGNYGLYLHDLLSLKIDESVISERISKSIGKEYTFFQNIEKEEEAIENLMNINERLVKALEKYHFSAKTITLKIKYNDFVVNTRSRTLNRFVHSKEEIFYTVKELLYSPYYPNKPIRLLGIQLSNLKNADEEINFEQLNLNF